LKGRGIERLVVDAEVTVSVNEKVDSFEFGGYRLTLSQCTAVLVYGVVEPKKPDGRGELEGCALPVLFAELKKGGWAERCGIASVEGLDIRPFQAGHVEPQTSLGVMGFEEGHEFGS
jgi:hypothetical protein